MGEGRELARAVVRLAGGLTLVLAGVAILAGRPADAVGLAVGTLVVLANFAGLRWGLDRLADTAGPGRRRALWMGATGLRLGAMGLAVGLAAHLAGQGWLGLPGLLAALIVFPLTVVAAGLRAGRLT